MVSVFEDLDLHLYEEIDSAALVRQLLDEDLPCDQYPNATVRSEIGTDINTLADGLCVIYDVGPAVNIGADRWRFPLSLSVFASDPDMGSRFKAWLYKQVMGWPYRDPVKAGSVRSVEPTGFRRTGPDDWNLARNVYVWSMEDVVVTALAFH